MSKLYAFSDYDKNLSLKMSFELWVIIAYFMKPFILKISTFQMGRGPKSDSVSGLKDLVYPDDIGFFLAFLATLPTILVCLAYMKRKPEGSDLIRVLWSKGALLLLSTSVLNTVVVFLPLVFVAGYHINMLGWGQLVIAIGIIIYLLTSRRVKDTFADFPAKSKADKAKK